MAWQASWPRPSSVAIAAVAVLVGVGAEAASYNWGAPGSWGPDLAVGWAIIGLGILVGRSSVRRVDAWLLCAAGVAWFFGNFAAVAVPFVAWVAIHGAFIHRAVLTHAVTRAPATRLGSPLGRGVVVLAYVVALWPALSTSDAASVAVGMAILSVAILGRARRTLAAVALAAAIGGIGAARLAISPMNEQELLHLYQAGLVLSAALVALAIRRGSGGPVFVDRVIELGGATTLRAALRRVVGDPSLELGFVRDDHYVDEQGQPLPPIASGSRMTRIAGKAQAVLIHNPQIGIDSGVVDSIGRALDLTAEHARLQAETHEQLAQLRASRRRLLLARDRQRVLMARRLDQGVEQRLAEIEASLKVIERSDRLSSDTVVPASLRVREARRAVQALARGLRPAALETRDLKAAFQALADVSPVPVLLTFEVGNVDPAIEQALYLICSEALANVAKHAHATTTRIRLAYIDQRLLLEIADDGRGGADPRGTGLRGLAERVAAFGGTLRIDSRPDRGTRLTVEVPATIELRERSPRVGAVA
jgi:signal transduction histidine kinase